MGFNSGFKGLNIIWILKKITAYKIWSNIATGLNFVLTYFPSVLPHSSVRTRQKKFCPFHDVEPSVTVLSNQFPGKKTKRNNNTMQSKQAVGGPSIELRTRHNEGALNCRGVTYYVYWFHWRQAVSWDVQLLYVCHISTDGLELWRPRRHLIAVTHGTNSMHLPGYASKYGRTLGISGWLTLASRFANELERFFSWHVANTGIPPQS